MCAWNTFTSTISKSDTLRIPGRKYLAKKFVTLEFYILLVFVLLGSLSFVTASSKGVEESSREAVGPELNSELHSLKTNIGNNFIEIPVYFHTSRFGIQIGVHLITSDLDRHRLCFWPYCYL